MKGCFSKYQPNFHYTIEYKGEEICKCHSLTGKDYNEILQACKGEGKLVDGKLQYEYNKFKDASMTFIRACDSWTLEDDEGNIVPITEEAFGELDWLILNTISSEISKHESLSMVDGASKN